MRRTLKDPTEEEALAVVRQAVARYGDGYTDGLALVGDDDPGEVQTLEEGRDLLERVQPAAPAFRPVDG